MSLDYFELSHVLYFHAEQNIKNKKCLQAVFQCNSPKLLFAIKYYLFGR